MANLSVAFYIVAKWSGSYPQYFNLTRIFDGNPAGGAYSPHIFDTKNATNNPSRDNPYVQGHVAALWNDYGPNATSYIEMYYSIRDGLPALGDKQWGGDLLHSEYDDIFETLQAAIPAQNLDRRIPSRTSTILEYDFGASAGDGVVVDSSGNDYHGVNHGCSISASVLALRNGCSVTTPLDTKGRNYTLSFSVMPASTASGPLFSGSASSLVAGNGSINNVTLITSGNAYSLNYSLPLYAWTHVALVGAGNATYLTVGAGPEISTMQFTVTIGVNGAGFVWDLAMAVEAPVASIGGGGFEGFIKDVRLVDAAFF